MSPNDVMRTTDEAFAKTLRLSKKKGKTKGPREGGGGEGGECGELSDSSTHFKSESSLFCCVFSDPHSAINMIMDREN